MDDKYDLEDLIESAQKGDAEAFRAIFDLYVDRMFNYALSRTSDREAAKDIVQDAFVDLWRSLGSYTHRSEDSFAGFIFLILKRRIIKHYRLARVNLSLDDSMDIVSEPEQKLEESEEVVTALAKLADRYQEVIKLRYWGALNFAEIGAALGLNETAARVLHHRALRQLQDSLNIS